MTIGQKIKELRESKNLTLKELAKKIGCSYNAISQWETGIQEPSSPLRKKLCEYFKITEAELFGGLPTGAITPHRMLRIPLLGAIPAGKPSIASEDSIEAWYELPAEFIGSETEYLLRVKGNSMLGEGILPGMFVGVSKKTPVRNGDIVVINIDDEYTLKRYYEKEGIITLQSANKDVPPITLSPKQHDLIKYIAKVTWYGRRLT